MPFRLKGCIMSALTSQHLNIFLNLLVGIEKSFGAIDYEKKNFNFIDNKFYFELEPHQLSELKKIFNPIESFPYDIENDFVKKGAVRFADLLQRHGNFFS